ncbi:MAG: hypothetical protein KDD85_02920 [Parvularculaceae bacterium]|nr:hypothetical protein [Parvularculaceae bacterium]
MGRFLLFIIIIVAALAGVWFYAPGGKDMLMGAKEKAMSYLPGAEADAADDTGVTSEEIIVDDLVDETMDDADDYIDDDLSADDMSEEMYDETGDDPAAEEEPQQ